MNTLRFQLVGDRWANWTLFYLRNEHVKVSVGCSLTVGQGIGHSFTDRIVQ